MNPSDLLADIAMRSQTLAEARRADEPEPATQSSNEAPAEPAPEPRDPAPIIALDDERWANWLRGLNPDSLLVLLVDAPEALSQRVVASLDDQSREWVRGNLALLDQVTAANQRQAWEHAWAVYDELAPVAGSAGEAPADDDLANLLLALVGAGSQGEVPWAEVVGSGREPLLAAAAAAAAAGLSGAELDEQLDELLAEHLAAERRRGEFMLDAVRSAVAGQQPAVFAERWSLEG